MKNKFKKGFTLIEMVVVIAIIGIIASISIGVVVGTNSKKKIEVAKLELDTIQETIEKEYRKNGLILSEGLVDAFPVPTHTKKVIFKLDDLNENLLHVKLVSKEKENDIYIKKEFDISPPKLIISPFKSVWGYIVEKNEYKLIELNSGDIEELLKDD